MKRYVESEEAKQTLKKLLYETAMNCLDSVYIGYHPSDIYADIANNRVDTWVDLVPTADVQEVVRCNDCVHRHQTTCPFLIANAYKASSDDDFCSRGERSEGGVQN